MRGSRGGTEKKEERNRQRERGGKRGGAPPSSRSLWCLARGRERDERGGENRDRTGAEGGRGSCQMGRENQGKKKSSSARRKTNLPSTPRCRRKRCLRRTWSGGSLCRWRTTCRGKTKKKKRNTNLRDQRVFFNGVLSTLFLSRASPSSALCALPRYRGEEGISSRSAQKRRSARASRRDPRNGETNLLPFRASERERKVGKKKSDLDLDLDLFPLSLLSLRDLC